MKRTLCLLGLIVADAAGGVTFDSETVAIRIDTPRSFVVDGCYCFGNSDARTRTVGIRYPFADDPWLFDAEDIQVTVDGRACAFSLDSGCILFPLSIRPASTCRLNVKYRQNSCNGRGRYILTTTGLWERPLRVAVYSIQCVAGTTVDSLPFVPDSVTVGQQCKTYRCTRKSFMPGSDLAFRWH
jgi:hypothetical protein